MRSCLQQAENTRSYAACRGGKNCRLLAVSMNILIAVNEIRIEYKGCILSILHCGEIHASPRAS